jgi:hypothetical protein
MAQITDLELLAAALAGYQNQLTEIEAKVAELKRRLGGKAAAPAAAPEVKKSRLSEAARARIAAAQRKRWAAARKAAAAATKAAAAPVKKTAGRKAAAVAKKAVSARKKAAAPAEKAKAAGAAPVETGTV